MTAISSGQLSLPLQFLQGNKGLCLSKLHHQGKYPPLTIVL